MDGENAVESSMFSDSEVKDASLLCVFVLWLNAAVKTRNSSGDETANVNFLYDDIVHVLQNTIDSCIPPQIDAPVMCGTHVYQIQ